MPHELASTTITLIPIKIGFRSLEELKVIQSFGGETIEVFHIAGCDVTLLCKILKIFPQEEQRKRPVYAASRQPMRNELD
jgi:hypothetical protein